MRSIKKIIVISLICIFVTNINAEKIAKPIKHGDKRLKSITYNPNEVTRLDTTFGITTALVFHKDEKILMSSVGDADAWQLDVAENILMIKPLVQQPFSNLIIQTNLHLYHFALDTLPLDADTDEAPYMISFKYPSYEKEKKKKEAAVKDLIARKKAAKRRKLRANTKISKKFNPAKHFSKNKDIANINYFYQGDITLKPSFIYDDNTHTYIHYLKSQARPAVYSLLTDGKESLVNRNDIGDWIVIQGVYKELRFRVGKSVLAIVNDAYSPLTYKRDAKKTKVKRFIKKQKVQ